MTDNDDVRMYSVPEAICMTPNGPGIVVHYETAYRDKRKEPFVRFGVLLDKNPFSYPIAYYRPDLVLGYPPPLEKRV